MFVFWWEMRCLGLKEEVARSGASRCEVIAMSQGQKVSRLLAWGFGEKG